MANCRSQIAHGLVDEKTAGYAVEMAEESLALMAQVAVLDETAGAWTDANHPEMRTSEDIDRWLDELRNSWGESAKRF
jgi:hypothetical protein